LKVEKILNGKHLSVSVTPIVDERVDVELNLISRAATCTAEMFGASRMGLLLSPPIE